MITRGIAVIVLASLAACKDETVAGYGASDHLWQLTEMDGRPMETRATLRFPRRGTIGGEGPCNAYSASMEVPYPWFETGPIRATRRACPDLAAEQAFFDALGQMTQSEVLGGTLILRDELGREMVFKAID